MTKIWVEICLISARGLTRTSSLWKLQWFAVGWIDPNNKYCTKIDASGNANPIWKTKFSALVDIADFKFEDFAINVEVYSRDPVFLKERLQGTAIVGLKEFLDKHKNRSEKVEEVGSFQLRKRNTNKPQGFVDVSIRISEETNQGSSYEGDEVGIKLRIHDHGVNLPPPMGQSQTYLETNYQTMLQPRPNYHQPPVPVPVPVSVPVPANYAIAGGSNHEPLHTPLGSSFINMPSSSGARPGPSLAMGLGAGALAAGAAIFGDDFVSGFDLPTSFIISTDPPF